MLISIEYKDIRGVTARGLLYLRSEALHKFRM